MIYEAHVRGLTKLHPLIPEEQRGTYQGLAHPAVIQYLQRLGVTAVELMPVHQFVPESVLARCGRSNYWGYNTIGFFAPNNAYAASGTRGQQVPEFKSMVRALHQAGIEVILDVVYDHTAEGDHLGPTLSFRGIDNAAYYRLENADPRFYRDTTGTGNSLLMRHPHVLQMIMDSLRYWVLEMHVDGFRFARAAALARQFYEVDQLSAFFDLVQQDPVVSQVKLIAEPWDVGEGGYQVGNFPPLWSEWNGKYRDTVRDFWRGQPATLPEFASRLTGLSDLYQQDSRRPVASVNFVTCHDGFTLADLVRYDRKHNEANGEGNRDGDRGQPVLELRRRRPRRRPGHPRAAGPAEAQLPGHAAAVPGRADAAGRRRDGPHPAGQQQRLLPGQRGLLGRLGGRRRAPGCGRACQARRAAGPGTNQALLEFVRWLVQFRADHPVFRRRRFFHGQDIRGVPGQLRDIAWFTPAGREMTDADWQAGSAKSLAVFLNGDAISEPGRRGEPIRSDSFLLLFNASELAVEFTLPPPRYGALWSKVLDTAVPLISAQGVTMVRPGDVIGAPGRSVQVLCRN